MIPALFLALQLSQTPQRNTQNMPCLPTSDDTTECDVFSGNVYSAHSRVIDRHKMPTDYPFLNQPLKKRSKFSRFILKLHFWGKP